MSIESRQSRFDGLFVVLCALGYALAASILPSQIALVEPDSQGYLDFEANRTALYPAFIYVCKWLGLGLAQITSVQLVLFCAALSYLLVTLLRAGFPRVLLALFVAVLAGNVLFGSFHWSILTESIYFSLGMVATALWIEFFRTGRAMPLALAGLVVGLMFGVRPVGMALFPLQVLAVFFKRKPNMSKWMLLAIALVPAVAGAGAERLLYRLVHHAPSQSTAPLLFMGKAAMLAEPGMRFTGPHTQALTALHARLMDDFGPWQKFLVDSPSFSVRLLLMAPYEGQAQSQGFLFEALTKAAAETGVTVDELRVELGKQVMLQNVWGYLKQTLLTEVGQWYVDAQRFPPIARLIAAYAAANPAIALDGRITPEMLNPVPSKAALLIFPAFLVAGVITFILALGSVLYVMRPSLMDTPAGFYFGIAVFLSAMCHGYTLFISLANVWTSRFLMAVFPQLGIIALCLVMAALCRMQARKLEHAA